MEQIIGKIVLIFISFILLGFCNTYSGCFPREDNAYIELISMKPKLSCLNIIKGPGHYCLGGLNVVLKNDCDFDFLYGQVLIASGKKLELGFRYYNIGKKWEESIAYKEQKDKKIILSFELKKQFRNRLEQRYLIGLVALISIFFIFLFRKKILKLIKNYKDV